MFIIKMKTFPQEMRSILMALSNVKIKEFMWKSCSSVIPINASSVFYSFWFEYSKIITFYEHYK